MSSMPFSLSDILERIVPGTIFLFLVLLAGSALVDVSAPTGLDTLIWFAFVAMSYAVGVMLNTLSTYLPTRGSRDFWSGAKTTTKEAIAAAIEAHYGVAADERAWALCYGTCAKHGFGANTQLFQGLGVFCRSMMTAMAISTMLFLAAAALAYARDGAARTDLFVVAGVCLFAALVFRKGAYSYDHAFIGSIYEGFYSWYCEQAEQGPSAKSL